MLDIISTLEHGANEFKELFCFYKTERSLLCLVIGIIGVLYILKFTLFTVQMLFGSVFCKIMSLFYVPDLRKYGQWAVITGSTDGIGKFYAIELAKRKMNIVLISRNMKKLEDCADFIRSQYRVKVKVIQTDFTDEVSIYKKIEEELKNLDIGILVNNVGTAPTHPAFRPLEDVPIEQLWNEIIVNSGASCLMTRAVLPYMKRRQRGMIVFVSSILGEIQGSYVTNYSATKAYMLKFMENIEHETSHYNIHVQSIIPGIIDTNLTAGDHFLHKLPSHFRSFLFPTASTYASWSIHTLGRLKVTTGYWLFDFLRFLNAILIVLRIRELVYRYCLLKVYEREVIH